MRKPLLKRKYGPNGVIGPAPRFTWKETECHDGTPVPKQLRKRVTHQARKLNNLRRVIARHYRTGFGNVSIHVNSWYRTPAYNKTIGGAAQSQHVLARATDITVKVNNTTLNPRTVAQLAEFVPAFHNGGIGWYDTNHGNFTHVDHRRGKARWVNG